MNKKCEGRKNVCLFFSKKKWVNCLEEVSSDGNDTSKGTGDTNGGSTTLGAGGKWQWWC